MEFNPLFIRQNLTGEGIIPGKPTRLDSPSFMFSDFIKVYKAEEQSKNDAVNVPLSETNNDNQEVNSQPVVSPKKSEMPSEKDSISEDSQTSENYLNAVAFLLGIQSQPAKVSDSSSKNDFRDDIKTDTEESSSTNIQDTRLSNLIEQTGTKPNVMLINPALYTANISSQDFMQNKIAGLQMLMMNEGIVGSTLPSSPLTPAAISPGTKTVDLPEQDAVDNPAILSAENQSSTTIDSFVFENFATNFGEDNGTVTFAPNTTGLSSAVSNSLQQKNELQPDVKQDAEMQMNVANFMKLSGQPKEQATNRHRQI